MDKCSKHVNSHICKTECTTYSKKLEVCNDDFCIACGIDKCSSESCCFECRDAKLWMTLEALRDSITMYIESGATDEDYANDIREYTSFIAENL